MIGPRIGIFGRTFTIGKMMLMAVAARFGGMATGRFTMGRINGARKGCKDADVFMKNTSFWFWIDCVYLTHN
jgi:hypothetical protein